MYIPCRNGPVQVLMIGEKTKPPLVTYHDLGLNSSINFKSFFAHSDMERILTQFHLIHINAPGQEEEALLLPECFNYPSMEQLAEQVQHVANYLNLSKFVLKVKS